MLSSAIGDGRLVEVVGQPFDDDAHLLLGDQGVDVAEQLGVLRRQRLFEQGATRRGGELLAAAGRTSIVACRSRVPSS